MELLSSIVTFSIMAACILLSIRAFDDQSLKQRLMYNPYMVHHRKQWYRMVTHAFIHGDYLHLGINMYVLYMFGTGAESAFGDLFGFGLGKFLFVVLYLGGLLFAALPGYGRHKDNPYYNSVGASGAVAAVVFASIIVFPQMELHPIFIPIPMPGYLFGILYLAYEAYMDKRGRDNVAHDAHLWGSLFGLGFLALIKPSLYVRFFEFITASM